MSLEFSAIHFLKLFKDGQMSPSLSYISALKTRHIINKSEHFSNKTIVITGTFKKFSRKKIEKILIEKGAIISSSVSKKTDLLFCGDHPGSKFKKAIKLKIKILESADVEEAIEN